MNAKINNKDGAKLGVGPRTEQDRVSEQGWMVEYMKEKGYVYMETYRDKHSVEYITVFYTSDGAGEVYFHAGGEPEYFYSADEQPTWIEEEGWVLVEEKQLTCYAFDFADDPLTGEQIVRYYSTGTPPSSYEEFISSVKENYDALDTYEKISDEEMEMLIKEKEKEGYTYIEECDAWVKCEVE